MKHKGGYVRGSIYERRGKGRNLSYTAEIQFQSHVIRRSLQDKELLQKWMDDVCERINKFVVEYNTELDNLEAQFLRLKKNAYETMLALVKPTLDEAKQYDLRHYSCANKIGLSKTDAFKTYLIKDEETGLIKIGKSKDIFTRIKTIPGDTLELIAYSERDIEVLLHRLYQHKRIKGEWFNLTKADVSNIVRKFDFDTPGGLFLRGTHTP